MSGSPLLDLRFPQSSGSVVHWGRLYGAARSLAVAETAARAETPVCLVTPTAAIADRLEREVAYFAPEARLLRFPDYETLPYEAISSPQDLLSERLSVLHTLASGEPGLLIAHADVLLNRLPPADFILARSLFLEVGQRLDRDAMAAQLVAHGYLRVGRVSDPGEFAVRGSILDVYPPGLTEPVRIDLFDDEIENLRQFDPRTQLSSKRIDTVKLLPAREFPFDAEAIKRFRERFREAFSVEPGRARIYRDISESVLPAGIEYHLPLFFDSTVSLLEYLPRDALLLELEGTSEALDSAWAMIESRYEQLSGDQELPILVPASGFWDPTVIKSQLAAHPCVTLSEKALEETGETVRNLAVEHPLSGGVPAEIDRFSRWLSSAREQRTLILTSSAGRREVLLELLKGRGYELEIAETWNDFVSGKYGLGIGVAELADGLLLPEHGLRVITAEQLGLEKPRQTTRRRRVLRDPEAIIRELTDLQIGAPVVHEEYGIGRYRGLATLEVDGRPMEFLLLEYADGDKLYVPVSSLHLVSRYMGASPENAPLHRLGSDQWQNAKKKAAQQARDIAAELLNLYAQRAARHGVRMQTSAGGYEKFCDEFPFEETEDQIRAISEVVDDLARDRPMDRIVCGDVGFGKTEVALRSTFIAVFAGHQVAVLVPTTLLAQQHFRTFSDRFADWPVKVKLLSRFNNSAQTKETLTGLASGAVDIVIGTHKLLQRNVEFKRLGLIVVDEEHRFGVSQKEALKKLKADVDILTMTATPIPRTLNMSLGGLRDLSIIATPPADRLSVKTFVGEWKDLQLREAVLRELRRGGQVYFIHNRVQDIDRIADRVRKLVPEAEIRVAHGQMSERALEAVMVDFYHRRFNLLVCTTIIESGIDIPTANTMIIHRADRLGLAQLHQLRGRVGRSHHQAYAYLLAPPVRTLTPEARKRLEALEALEELGSGFTLATHDLEIRGAGELLGAEQSGQIQAIGFTLYNELLARAVKELRAGREPNLEDPFRHGPEIDVGLVALIPEDYMPDVHMRLVHYKRIASAGSIDELDDLQVELIDRFGLLPDATKALFAVTSVKLLAQSLGIKKLRAAREGGTVEFAEGSSIDPIILVKLLDSDPAHFRLDGPYKLRFKWEDVGDSARIDKTMSLLKRLGATEHAEQAVESAA